ncbi:MAG: hypothetical protein ABH871_08350 [Pseudomonadota bacterium]
MIAAGEAVQPAATPAANSEAIGDISTGMGWMGAASAVQAVGQMAGSIISYYSQQNLMEIQKEATIARYDHQDRMAVINKDMQIKSITSKQDKMHVASEGQKQLNAAVQERKKAEDGLKIAEARGKEMKLTEKTGKTNDKALDKLFNTYSYGNPYA